MTLADGLATIPRCGPIEIAGVGLPAVYVKVKRGRVCSYGARVSLIRVLLEAESLSVPFSGLPAPPWFIE